MRVFRLMLFTVLFLSACSPANQASPAKPTIANTSAAYPAPAGSEPTRAYPAPTGVQAILPTRDPSKAVVKGRLLLKGAPVTYGIIFLSPVLKDKDGRELVVGLDREKDMRGDFDPSGNFQVMNVPPGRYGVIYDVITQAYLLMVPDKDESLIIDVPAGKDLDLGDLNYSDLPTR